MELFGGLEMIFLLINIIDKCNHSHRKFKTLAMMTKDWHDCVNNEIGMQETICKAKLSDRITNAMLVLHTLSVVAYGTRIILANVDVTDRTSQPPYIHKMELPFDVNTQRVYKMVVIAQFVYVIMCSWVAGAVNALNFGGLHK